jgi:iron only hydrogenase large subunit-like protein
MEEGSELVHRMQNGGTLPMLTSCSPGWIKFVEQFYPDFIENVSTCKSPQQMLGAVIKTYFAERGHRSGEDLQRVADALHGQEVRGRLGRRWRATACPTSTPC